MINREQVNNTIEMIKRVYLADQIPWVVGYSGGKDSTAVLQLVWTAISELPEEERKKKIYVITNDTLVESPVVAKWVEVSLNKINRAATASGLPFEAHILLPELKDRFWVCLLGKGYPYPRKNFRWCTERLKIKSTNIFIQKVVSEYGEVIVVLGTRKAESANRMRMITEREQYEYREGLLSKTSLQNKTEFMPIKNWTDDDVWAYLLQYPNPWSNSNRELLTMYRGATKDNECPIVMSTDTPSCGKSRFGCWVCTLVAKDSSLAAMVHNDDEKAWMIPLLQFRDDFGDHEHDRLNRDFTLMSGKLKIYNNRLVHGPYKKEVREGWLRTLLEIETNIRQTVKGFENFKIITEEELLEIRRIWVEEKFELDDAVPRIYEEVKNKVLDTKKQNLDFGLVEYDILKEICEEEFQEEELLFKMMSALIQIERKNSNTRRRVGLTEKLTKTIERFYYRNEEDALAFAQKFQIRREEANEEFMDGMFSNLERDEEVNDED